MITIENEFGKIKITKKAVARTISEAIAIYENEIFLTNEKGKILKLRHRDAFTDISHDIDMEYDEENGLSIHFCLLLRFGMSINAVTNQIFDTIMSEMQACFGLAPAKMAITITGMYSKDIKNVAKRDVEVVR